MEEEGKLNYFDQFKLIFIISKIVTYTFNFIIELYF